MLRRLEQAGRTNTTAAVRQIEAIDRELRVALGARDEARQGGDRVERR